MNDVIEKEELITQLICQVITGAVKRDISSFEESNKQYIQSKLDAILKEEK